MARALQLLLSLRACHLASQVFVVVSLSRADTVLDHILELHNGKPWNVGDVVHVAHKGAKSLFFPRSIVIRQCYDDLYTLFSAVAGGDTLVEERRKCVTGTPGIGKSTFLVYVMWRALYEGKAVLFHHFKGKEVVYRLQPTASGGVDVTRLPTPDADSVDVLLAGLNPKQTWYLADSLALAELREPNCPVLEVTSPDLTRLKGLDSVFPAPDMTLYMPLWSRQEVSSAAGKLRFPVDKVTQAYEKHGGIARFVLAENPDVNGQKLQLVQRDAKVTSIRALVSADGTVDRVSNRLVHWALDCTCDTDSDNGITHTVACYCDFKYVIASKWVGHDFVVKILNNSRAELVMLLKSAGSKDPKYSSLVGWLWEECW